MQAGAFFLRHGKCHAEGIEHLRAYIAALFLAALQHLHMVLPHITPTQFQLHSMFYSLTIRAKPHIVCVLMVTLYVYLYVYTCVLVEQMM